MKSLREILESLGLIGEEIGRMERLLTGKPTEAEKKRWRDAQILDDNGKIILADGEEGALDIAICIFNDAYNGLVRRAGNAWVYGGAE